MARPQSSGLPYFPLDSDFFSDKKIKILKARYGTDGVIVYLYLLCEIYRNGYYIKWDEDYKFILAKELNLSDGFIEQVLTFLLERSLLDSTLFKSDTILTSPGIQRRYQRAVKDRARKTPIKVGRFWLLSEEETETFIKVIHEGGSSGKNGGFFPEKPGVSPGKMPKSKVKKSKVNNIPPISPCEGENDLLSTMVQEGKIPAGLEEAVREWLAYKAERKQGYKETGLKNLLSQIGKNVDAYGAGAVAEVIRLSMSNNWQGIAWDRIGKTGDGKGRAKAQGNRFNNFHQRDYDFEKLEKDLLNN